MTETCRMSSDGAPFHDRHDLRAYGDSPQARFRNIRGVSRQQILSTYAASHSRPHNFATAPIYNRYTSASQQYDPSQSQRDTTPTVFGNLYEAGSVMTGISQQELLRKKPIEDAKKKRYKKAKKGRLQAIVNMPSALSHGIMGNTTKSFYGEMSSAAGNERGDRFAYHGQGSDDIGANAVFMEYIPPAPLEPRTTKSHRHVDMRANSYGIPSLYSTLPVQQTVVNEADGDGMLMWPTPGDNQSVDSFPILSNHRDAAPVVSFPILSRQSGLGCSGVNGHYSARVHASHTGYRDTSRINDDPNNVSTSSTNSKRSVRFTENSYLEHQDSHTSIPWDERDDEPPSLSKMHGTDGATPRPVVVTPVSSTSQPKSILRVARFAVNPSTARSASAYLAGTDAMRARPLYKSPPRQKIAFIISPDGDEPSSIGPTKSHAICHTDALQVDEEPAYYNHSGTSTFDEIVEKANALYPKTDETASLDEKWKYSDPELDGFSQFSEPDPAPVRYQPLGTFDEEDDGLTASSLEATFIQTIAAIVIQAAFRRHRMQWIFADMLARRKVKRLHGNEPGQNTCAKPEPPSSLIVQPEVTSPNVKQRAREIFAAPQSEPAHDKVSCAKANATIQSRNDSRDLAATRLQALYRGFWARDCLSVDSYCATLIQKRWRTFQARQTFLFEIYSIIVVQSAWRRSVVRSRVGISLYYIVLLQSTVRGFLCRKDYHALQAANLQNQRTRYGLQPRSNEKSPRRKAIFAKRIKQQSMIQNREEAMTAATKIQAAWRRFSQEGVYIRSLVDVMIAQTVVRRWIARRRTNKHMKPDRLPSYRHPYGFVNSGSSAGTTTTIEWTTDHGSDCNVGNTFSCGLASHNV